MNSFPQYKTINFVIPYFKEEAYLLKALESIIAQHNPNWYVVVVDDQPEDNDFCKKVVEKLNNPRISYLRKLNHTDISDSWNQCVSLIENGLLTILHADDELKPNYTDLVLNAHERYPFAKALFTGSETIDARGKKVFSLIDCSKGILAGFNNSNSFLSLNGEHGLCKLLKGNFITCSSVCYRVDRFEKFYFYNYHQVLDHELITRFLLDGEEIIGIPPKAFRYRRHAKNFSVKNNRALIRFREESMLYESIAERAEKLNWHKAARIARLKLPVIGFLLYSILKLEVSIRHVFKELQREA